MCIVTQQAAARNAWRKEDNNDPNPELQRMYIRICIVRPLLRAGFGACRGHLPGMPAMFDIVGPLDRLAASSITDTVGRSGSVPLLCPSAPLPLVPSNPTIVIRLHCNVSKFFSEPPSKLFSSIFLRAQFKQGIVAPTARWFPGPSLGPSWPERFRQRAVVEISGFRDLPRLIHTFKGVSNVQFSFASRYSFGLAVDVPRSDQFCGPVE
jgi:hypothetical protein